MESTSTASGVSHTRIDITLPVDLITQLITSADIKNLTIAQFITEAIQEALNKR